ncbi:hypothetical protein BC936DRAFT_146517 [Jimgerdemannia flammicorona]|uniref:Small EDRK-rich factor-like N-terminal domain-containing protein n=2 Tax=Jimgerdemannia flammicorona TaxID=994334 RepID=A0A433D7F9_9FUNG|nr:hypothetical protein BC936DRAFT_146517 [Jimgerdemannia flammicorona]
MIHARIRNKTPKCPHSAQSILFLLACQKSYNKEIVMTRGNQRERDREKALKKAQNSGKKREDGKTVLQRKETDAEIMRKKQEAAAAKAAEAKAAEAAGGGSKS